jgi:hypothetical protein
VDVALCVLRQDATPGTRKAGRPGYGPPSPSIDYLWASAGLTLERRDLDIAEQFAEQALSISERSFFADGSYPDFEGPAVRGHWK